MMIAVWVVVGLVVLVAMILGAFAVLGSRLPPEHAASLTLALDVPAEKVWDLVADAESHATWAEGVNKVEKLPDRDGRPAYRQTMGRNSFVLETTQSRRPELLERTIADDHKFFSGCWRYQLTPANGGCVLTLTEIGRVPSAIPRAMMHYLFGTELYIRKHLTSVARALDQSPKIT